MISDQTINSLIIGIPAFLTSLAGLIAVIRGNKKTDTKVNALTEHVNGKMQELINATGREKQAQGHSEGLAEGRQASAAERQQRVTESERVQDREDERNSNKL